MKRLLREVEGGIPTSTGLSTLATFKSATAALVSSFVVNERLDTDGSVLLDDEHAATL
jgi:galactokinase